MPHVSGEVGRCARPELLLRLLLLTIGCLPYHIPKREVVLDRTGETEDVDENDEANGKQTL